MPKTGLSASAAVLLVLIIACGAPARETVFEYPGYLVDAYEPNDKGWTGMGISGLYPVHVVPEKWLVGPPPSQFSGITLPPDHWIELQFRNPIVNGPGEDIIITELGRAGEKALIFLTDGAGREYLLNAVTAADTGGELPTIIKIDIARASLPFEPVAVRILGTDYGGLAPGFDVANVRARVNAYCGPKACKPCPVDAAQNVPITETNLSWVPGISATKHNVYFGRSPNDVDVNAVPVLSPDQPQDANSYYPGTLELGTTYYWRIDEVNQADPNSPWTGDIWTFKTTDYLVLDDFEFYDSGDNRIYDTWKPIDQAFVSPSQDPDPVHKGGQSMSLAYYVDPVFISEAARTFSPAQNWLAAGVRSIEVFFRGKADNRTDVQMYLAVGDGNNTTVVPYAGDSNDLKIENWLPWRLNLAEMADVNFCEVRHLALGFRCDPSLQRCDGKGSVYFDDLRLYPRWCFEEYRPQADFNGDCVVGYPDLRQMTDYWLLKGYNVYPAAPPPVRPVAWYRFDGDVADSTGKTEGKMLGNPEFAPGVYGQAISLDGWEDAVEMVRAVYLFSAITHEITITFWQRGLDSPHHTDTLFCSDYTYGLKDPAIALNLGCWRRPGRYNWDCGQPWSFENRLSGAHELESQWTGRWNHWAFTKDTQAGEDPNKGVMKVYLNGRLHESRKATHSSISQIKSFQIGNGWYGAYDGLIDDFRIYDYALTGPEIVHVATNGTGIFDLPLLSPIDLNNDDIVNFGDFAILADNWLENHLRP